ncbi:MAG: SH3 domain-containing protein [Steroidobacteraceae bacterium]|jgi:hypothetical protein
MRATPIVGSLAAMLLGLGLCGASQAQTPADPQPTPSAGYSAAQLYNSANAYARSGKTALAVLEYERARVLAPTDRDLRLNLRRVRESAGLPADTGSWLEQYGRFANPNTLYWVGIAGLVLGGGCLLARRSDSRFRGALLAGAIAGFAAAAASAFNAAATFGVLSESVALRQASAGVSPVVGADPLFQIPAAATVRVLDEHGGFELIRDSQGREGWVAATDLAAVIPSAADRS